ncbi:hypothetical protein GCM10009745_70520 [Kribbella yunnanensis]|uniref:Uncharacterized protein n=1 Tax=Kribbella yunnanensis TaxID=190194 RepID=A0ABP4UXU7_9ACTN
MRPSEVVVPKRFDGLTRDVRGYPVIATVPQDAEGINFGRIGEDRKLAIATYDLCGVCARPFRDELRWLVTGNRDWESFGASAIDSTEAPVHEVCALYAAQVCPFVSSPFARLGDDHRRGQRRPDVLALIGFERVVEVKAAASELQPGKRVLEFTVAGAARAHVLENAEDARTAYARCLTEEPELVLDEHEQRVFDLLAAKTKEGEDSGGVVAGGALMIGAAFCPGVEQVVGLGRFFKGDSPYRAIATGLLREPDKLADFGESVDSATAAASRWFASRSELPVALGKWIADERSRLQVLRRSLRVKERAKEAKRRAAKAAKRKKRR